MTREIGTNILKTMLIPSNDKQNKNEILKIEASASQIASWTKNTTEFVTFSMAKIRIDILNAVFDILFSQVDAAKKNPNVSIIFWIWSKQFCSYT